MTAEARYQDQFWQLERKLADLHGERLVLVDESQRASMRLFEIEQDMKRIQLEMYKYRQGEFA